MKGKSRFKRLFAAVSAAVMMCGVLGLSPVRTMQLAEPITAEAYNWDLVDDYPSQYKAAALDALVDEWNYYNRECTSFVAWRLNSRNGVAFHNWYGGVHFGNANSWGDAARSIGIAVDMNPAPGSVFWTNEGQYGHVAWVNTVNSDGTVTIEEYNWDWDGAYHNRTVAAGSASGYIHIADINPRPIGPEMDESEAAGKTVFDGDYWLGSKISQILFVDPAPGNDIPAAVSANVSVTNYPDELPGKQDVWTFTYLNNGFYKITQKGTDMCLDVTGASQVMGTNVQLYPWHDNTAQEWSVESTEWGYRLRSRRNSFCLTVVENKSDNGTNVDVWEWNGTEGQLFNLVSYYSFTGKGTANAPYQIGTAEDMNALALMINDENSAPYFREKQFIQTADIDLGGKIFCPIGTKTDVNPNGGGFNGVYDGQYHKVTGLKVDRDRNYNGLFGWSYGGTIRNLDVYGDINGKSPCGGIVGEIGTTKLSTVVNCSFNGTVNSTTGSAGGIVGHVWESGQVQNCYFNGSITSSAATPVTGGIVGTVSAGNSGGGGNVAIENCYAVSLKKVMGGIAGVFNLNNTASKLSVSNNYYLQSMADAAMTGYTVGDTKALSAEALKKMGGTDLGFPYIQNGNSNLNDGYPVFQWQLTVPAFTYGDVNDDGSVDLKDVTFMRRALAGWDVTINEAAADANKDGSFDLKDVVILRRYLAGGWGVEL